jgi:DNA transformation protein
VGPDDIRELFSGLGQVSIHRMFGGAGVYADGVMFALVTHGIIYLKADEQTAPDFEREGLAPFVYTARNGRRTVMSYRRMADRLYDDPEEAVRWARTALGAAKRAASKRSAATRRQTERDGA